MKKKYKYRAKKILKKLLIIVVITIVTYFLSGLQINCTQKTKAVCVERSWTESTSYKEHG